MSRENINIGVQGNDGTGDSFREAFRKANSNFSELYGLVGAAGEINITDLDDMPDSYSAGQILISASATSESGVQFLAKTLVAGDGIQIDNATGTLTVRNTTSTTFITDEDARRQLKLARRTVSTTTATLANGVSENMDVTVAVDYILYKIQASAACDVQIYSSDSNRTSNINALVNVAIPSATTVVANPGHICYNNATNSSTTFIRVTNRSGSSAAITVTLTVTNLEYQ
jgi:hypothetical protein